MINLLPQRQKEEIAEEKGWKLIFISGTLSLFFLVSLILVLLAVKINIQGEARSREIIIASEEKTFKISEIRLLEDKVRAFNGDLAKLSDFYKNQRDLTELLENISAILPKGVYLTNISLNENVFLSGHSLTRDGLLAFKKNLESDPGLSDVNFPSSSWVKPKDVDFTVSFAAKKQQ